MIIQRHIVVLI